VCPGADIPRGRPIPSRALGFGTRLAKAGV
jgi:hypothetical protein